MLDLKDYNLKENPFQYITANPSYDSADTADWFGMQDLKGKVMGIYEDLIHKKPRQVVLNWGPYGGGKTYTAYHFLKEKSDDVLIRQVYIRSPKQGGKAGIEFYKSIINYLSYRKIRKQIQNLKSLLGVEELFDFLHKRIRSEELSEAILLIGSDDEATSKMMHRYVYDGLTKTELKQVGLAKNIDWGTDSIKFLSGIFHCFIGDQDKYKGKVVLWIDEMEDMIYYSQKDYRSFSQVLRDLMDSLNQHFCIFMNFTLAESEESTIGVLLGEALWSRITKKVRFKELDIDGALNYTKEAISHYQIDSSKEYFPFNEELMKDILNMIPSENLTPREINRFCSGVLNLAQKNETKKLTLEVVAKYLEQIDDDE